MGFICCEGMENILESGFIKEVNFPDKIGGYFMERRKFISQTEWDYEQIKIFYCPFCGKDLTL